MIPAVNTEPITTKLIAAVDFFMATIHFLRRDPGKNPLAPKRGREQSLSERFVGKSPKLDQIPIRTMQIAYHDGPAWASQSRRSAIRQYLE
jgi:hypothetical protein